MLDGTWEAVVYAPADGRSMPDAALALGFSQPAAAVAAMEGFVRSLQQHWPVRRSFFAVDDAEGACLLDLGVLPELAPCYVASDRALVVGYNPASLRRALADGVRGPATGRGLVVELQHLPEADARLAAALPDLASDDPGDAAPRAPLVWPWPRLVADGERSGDGLVLRLALGKQAAARAEPKP